MCGTMVMLTVQAAATQEGHSMQARITINGQVMVANLNDTVASQDFVSFLPLDLMLEDYANNEKIAFLPMRLKGTDAVPFNDERVGDVCYYAPWGNIVLFHGSYHYSRGLVRLGRIDGAIEPLLTPGKFPVRIEAKV